MAFPRALLPLLALPALAGCGKTAARTWTPSATVSGSGSGEAAAIPLKGWVQMRYTLEEAQDKPVKIFLSDRTQARGIPRLITVETKSTAKSGVVEQELTDGNYNVFTSANGTWRIEVAVAGGG